MTPSRSRRSTVSARDRQIGFSTGTFAGLQIISERVTLLIRIVLERMI
jgi:hypothetical protein